MADYDVVVVGAGNAALAVAVSAREQGAERVAVFEKAPRELRGGNTHYSGGLLRFAYQRGEDLLPLVPDVEAALPCGQWTGCHSTPIDAEAPPHGDRTLTDKTNRLSYPFGLLVDIEGRRFFDEGEDFQLYTYAKLGGIILNRPRGVAFQIFDAKVAGLLEGRYRTGTPATADSLKALVEQLPVDRSRCLATLEAYNASVGAGTFDPTIRDGLRTTGLALPKSNWAQRLDRPPFTAWAVTGGITFTFGGVKVDGRAQVQNTSWMPVPGLYACGEMVGGLFHGNYPGGTGLMSGAVFGRIAGASAAGA
jgi:tricarballylate dehydrogenase